jgi:hypothetical protein
MHLRSLATDLGLSVHKKREQFMQADDAFVVDVGDRKHPWWDTIEVWRLPMSAIATINVTYNRIGDYQGRPITPQRAIRIMHKAARRQGLR